MARTLADRIEARLTLSEIEPAKRVAIRHRAGLTRKEAGQIIGVSAQTIWLYETGRGSPRDENLFRYLGLLETLASR